MKAWVLTMLTVVTALSLCSPAVAQTNPVPICTAMVFTTEYLDLETGEIIYWLGPPPPECDFRFTTYAGEMYFTQRGPAQVAYIPDSRFANIDWLDVLDATFTPDGIHIPFGYNDTMLIHTYEGNYFKVGLALESGGVVDFCYMALDESVIPTKAATWGLLKSFYR